MILGAGNPHLTLPWVTISWCWRCSQKLKHVWLSAEGGPKSWGTLNSLMKMVPKAQAHLILCWRWSLKLRHTLKASWQVKLNKLWNGDTLGNFQCHTDFLKNVSVQWLIGNKIAKWTQSPGKPQQPWSHSCPFLKSSRRLSGCLALVGAPSDWSSPCLSCS